MQAVATKKLKVRKLMETTNTEKQHRPVIDQAPPTEGYVSPGMVEVKVDDYSELDRKLNEALEAVRAAATRHQIGIMVTRTGPGQYVVRAHPAVPSGLVRRQHE